MVNKLYIGIGAIVAAVLFSVAPWSVRDQGVFISNEQAVAGTLELAGQTVQVALATTNAARRQGLSDTSELPEGMGMLFVYPKSDRYGFWMKDMNYPIDMIWLDGRREVVHIVTAATPESYPMTFTPNEPARYVLEVPAYFASEHGLTVGDSVTFSDGLLDEVVIE